MSHSIATFHGQAALSSITVTIARVNQGQHAFFHVWQTGQPKAGACHSPLNSISYQLAGDPHSYAIREHILEKGWAIERCAFRLWMIGPLTRHPACDGVEFHEACSLALILVALIHQHLVGNGHETVKTRPLVLTDKRYRELIEIAQILFEEFLRDTAPTLLEALEDSLNLT